MKQVILRIMMAVAVMLVTIGISAAPAHAAWSSCSGNRFCVWIDANGTGSMYYWTTEVFNQCTYIGPPFHDAVTSIKNNYNNQWKVVVWTDVNCAGGVISYSLWQGYFAPGNQKSLDCWLCPNDTASSFKVQAL